MADDIVYSASLDDDDVIKSLKNIDRQIDKTAKDGAQSFDKLSKSVRALTALEFTGRAFGAFERGAEIVKDFTDAAAEAQAAEASLAFSANAAAREFGTSVGTATTWKNTIQELGDQTRIYSEQELTGATTRLIDMTKRLGLSEEQMREVLKRTIDLSAGKVDLQGGIERVTSALRGEAESAEYLGLSLNENAVKKYAEAQGLVWKNLSDTEKAQQRYNLLLEQTNELQGRAADYASTLAGQQQALNAQLADQKVLIGEQLLPLQQGYVELLGNLSTETEGGASIITKALAGIAAAAGTFVEAVKAAFTIARIEFGALAAAGNALLNLQNPITAANQALMDSRQEGEQAAAVLSNLPTIFSQAFEGIQEGWQQQREGAQQAAEDFANTTVKVIAEELPDEVKKALDKLNDIERDAARDRIDIIRKAGQKTVDTEEEFIQKRIDQALKFLREIEDIERKNAQAIADSATDLRRDEEDAQIDYQRKLIALEKESAKDRIKIEEDYRDEIRKIQGNFDFDLEEAARNRDSVTYQRLLRQRDKQIAEARTTRDARLKENTTENEDKREQLKLELQYELEDAKLADDRRLEDLRLRLERELDEARIKNSRELDDLTTNEERKRAELARSLEIQLSEARLANERRVADYKESLDEEIAALVEAEQKKAEILQASAENLSSIASSNLDLPSVTTEQAIPTFQGGGTVPGPVGQPRLIMAHGGETITPASPVIMSPLMGGGGGISNMTTFNNTINQSMLDPSQQSAMMRAIARNEAVSVMQRLING